MVNLDTSFFGGHDVTLDEAGRIAIPRAFRDKLEDGQVVLTRGVNTCIRLYTTESWQKRVEEIVTVEDPDTIDGSEIWLRFLAPATPPLTVDKQGRILIPDDLREFAGLSKDCKVVGLYKYIEIWDKERFTKKDKEISQEKFSQISDAFARKKKEMNNAGSGTHPGIAGGDNTVSRSGGQE